MFKSFKTVQQLDDFVTENNIDLTNTVATVSDSDTISLMGTISQITSKCSAFILKVITNESNGDEQKISVDVIGKGLHTFGDDIKVLNKSNEPVRVLLCGLRSAKHCNGIPSTSISGPRNNYRMVLDTDCDEFKFVFVESIGANVERSPKNKRKVTGYRYQPLSSLVANNKKWNLIAIVHWCSEIRLSNNGSKYELRLKLVDESIKDDDMEPIEILLQASSQLKLPNIPKGQIAVGDVIRCHRLVLSGNPAKVGTVQGYGQIDVAGFAIVVWNGHVGESLEPLFCSSKSFSYDQEIDRYRIQTLREWVLQNERNVVQSDRPLPCFISANRRTMSQLELRSYCDILGMVTGVVISKLPSGKTCSVVRVIDGTPLTEFDDSYHWFLMADDSIAEEWSESTPNVIVAWQRDYCSWALRDHYAVDIVCWDEFSATASKLIPGSFALFENVHIYVKAGEVAMTMHSNQRGKYRRSLQVIPRSKKDQILPIEQRLSAIATPGDIRDLDIIYTHNVLENDNTDVVNVVNDLENRQPEGDIPDTGQLDVGRPTENGQSDADLGDSDQRRLELDIAKRVTRSQTRPNSEVKDTAVKSPVRKRKVNSISPAKTTQFTLTSDNAESAKKQRQLKSSSVTHADEPLDAIEASSSYETALLVTPATADQQMQSASQQLSQEVFISQDPFVLQSTTTPTVIPLRKAMLTPGLRPEDYNSSDDDRSAVTRRCSRWLENIESATSVASTTVHRSSGPMLEQQELSPPCTLPCEAHIADAVLVPDSRSPCCGALAIVASNNKSLVSTAQSGIEITVHSPPVVPPTSKVRVIREDGDVVAELIEVEDSGPDDDNSVVAVNEASGSQSMVNASRVLMTPPMTSHDVTPNESRLVPYTQHSQESVVLLSQNLLEDAGTSGSARLPSCLADEEVHERVSDEQNEYGCECRLLTESHRTQGWPQLRLCVLDFTPDPEDRRIENIFRWSCDSCFTIIPISKEELKIFGQQNRKVHRICKCSNATVMRVQYFVQFLVGHIAPAVLVQLNGPGLDDFFEDYPADELINFVCFSENKDEIENHYRNCLDRIKLLGLSSSLHNGLIYCNVERVPWKCLK